MVKDYMGDGLAADYVTDFIQHWFSRKCNRTRSDNLVSEEKCIHEIIVLIQIKNILYCFLLALLNLAWWVFSSPLLTSESFSICLGCNKEPVSIQKDQAFLNNAQQILQQFDGAMNNITESVINFCETTDTDLFIDMTATSMKYLCGVLGLTLDVREVFQCKTWMPLYYNTSKCGTFCL